ncbi:MAG: S-layer homology domain-containing protein [Bacillota bacterium]
MRKRNFLMMVVLVVVALSCGPAASGEPSGTYADIGSHWAAGDIEKCRVYRLMSGYPGNLFLPDRYMSRAEALAVIGRSMGWDRHLGNTSTEGIVFPEDLWDGFRIYVVYAANKGLIAKADISGIKFNEPSTRMEIFLWLAQALNLTGSGANLNFADTESISTSQRDMLAGVVEAGIIKGFPGNHLNPSGNLTRAEMAAILARLIDSGKIPSLSGRQYTGDHRELTGAKGYVVNKYPDYFTVHLDFGSVVKIQPDKVSLLINGSRSTYGSLQKGLPVELFKVGSTVTEVHILDGVPKVFGKVKEVKSTSIVIKDEDGKTAIYDIINKARILDVHGAETDIEEIEVGLNAEIVLSNNYNVREIKLYKSSGRDLQGKVESIEFSGNKKITVVENGKRQTFYLADNMAVESVNQTLRLEDIKKGTDVRLLLDTGNRVTGIEIIDLSSVYGKVDKVQTEGTDRITIKDRTGQSKTYYIAEGVTVKAENRTVELKDLRAGADVMLSLGDDDRVIGIEKVDLSTVIGRVTGIRKTGTRWIIIKTDSNREEICYVDSNPDVREGIKKHSFGFIEEGMRVKLSLNYLGKVTGVEIIEIHSITGTISAIQTSGVKKIKLRDKERQERDYYLANGVVVREAGRSFNLEHLKNGMNVMVNFDNNGRVANIEVLTQLAVEGEVTYIRDFGIKKIEIEGSGGLKEAHYLGDMVPVVYGGTSRNLGDIAKGMRVRLTLDDRGDVSGIDIIDIRREEGKVKLIPRWGSGKIGIVKSDGQEETYDIDRSVVVRENDSGRELDYIFEGMRVGLVLDSKDRVTRIDILGLYTVRGKVTLIQTAGTKSIMIKEIDGRERSYKLANNVTVKKGNAVLGLGGLNKSMDVELTLDNELKVIHIVVMF